MTRRISLALLTLLFVATTAIAGTTVRGRVYAADGKTPYPSVAVTLRTTDGKGATVYTDRDGMFYVGVGPGTYDLIIATPRTKKTFRIVAESKEYTDIAPVSVP